MSSSHSRRTRSRMPPGVQEGIMVSRLGGEGTMAVARRYGVDKATVARLSSNLDALDGPHVARIRRGLASMMTLLAAAHAEESLQQASSNPASASRSMLSAKLATDALRNMGEWTDAPGLVVLAYVGRGVGGGATEVPVQQLDLLPTEAPSDRDAVWIARTRLQDEAESTEGTGAVTVDPHVTHLDGGPSGQ